MATDATVEQRLAKLELQVAELRREVRQRPLSKNWLDQFIGAFRKYPEFGEVIEYGRQFRQASGFDDETEA